tara:strand:+ start:300 stop:500 length:201 start_codon:yes stop_codon:yes gene_type:complete
VRPPEVVSERSWRKWVLGILGLLLADHLGLMELHEIVQTDRLPDAHELIAIIAAAGAAISSFRTRR